LSFWLRPTLTLRVAGQVLLPALIRGLVPVTVFVPGGNRNE